MLTIEQINWISPNLVGLAAGLSRAIQVAELNSGLRLVHFLAQCGYESGGFKRMVENLNYSAEGLASTWPVRFSTTGKTGGAPNQRAKYLARKPEAIANAVYANRMGNGDEASGDGWLYRGRSPIQLTFYGNYASCSQFLFGDARLLKTPDIVLQPEHALPASAWFWQANRLNIYADKDDLASISGVVNTGKATGRAHGLDDGDRSDLDSRMDWAVLLKKIILGE